MRKSSKSSTPAQYSENLLWAHLGPTAAASCLHECIRNPQGQHGVLHRSGEAEKRWTRMTRSQHAVLFTRSGATGRSAAALIKHRTSGIGSATRRFTFQHFLLAVPHDVDVLNADELEFNVGVIVFVFIALSRSPVCECVQLEKTSGTHFFRRSRVI